MRVYLPALLLCLSHAAFSSSFFPPDTTVKRPAKAKQSVSLQLGTTGPGIYYNRVLNRPARLTLRVGGQYVAYRDPIRVKAGPDAYVTVKPDFMIGLAQANLKWHPFRRGSVFLTAGLGYTWHPTLSIVVTAENTLNFDGLVLTPEDVGTLNLGFRWRPVVGYLGWGFGRSIPRKRVGVGFEMGVFYLGRPRVQLAYEGFLETTTLSEQVPVVERNLSNYRYLPSLNVTLCYALHPTR